MAELQKLGVRSVPVLSRGDKYTFGQSTKQIVDFLGLAEKSGPELSTEELAARADKFLPGISTVALIRIADRTLLFDTGPYAYRPILQGRLKRLAIDPSEIDTVILSHVH